MNTLQPAQRRPISVVITVDPAPLKGVDDFNLTAVSASEGFTVDQPVVVAQQPRNGAQLLTIMIRVYPSPPSPPAAPIIPWWLARANPGESQSRPGSAQLAVRNDTSAPERRAIIILITVNPAPIRREDSFKIAALSATEGYTVDPPVVLGRYSRNAGQSLTLKFCVYPSPPSPPSTPPVPWWIIKPNPEKFGRLIRQARERARFTQAELARQTGLSEMTIRNVETGALACSPKTRNAVLEALARAGQKLSAEDPEPQQEDTEDCE